MGVRTATGPELFEPTPVSATIWGLFCALSSIVRVPLRTPEAAGVNVIVTVQLELGSRVAEQPLTCEKSPVMFMVLMLRVVLPVLVNVTVWAALDVPTC